ncbi:Fur family transcriptional regulator [Leadbetterella byssophila]|jgi:Fur family ferric uptake transcriptional regulator|uniref:Ferric uptake regulator family protein n=1 Tax=Leadbetterella byssophila (strain DSM 17132 / JCM 16389 / KACC 11308 / NBRC 106382 / 4M15) TaxID=649349 RepID=E4RZV3_LEAB4|nr:transcriptional repressor [Leadbetterella byssophila]ADQ19245.1 ferric uptake regulator family protein [Leadbetterella byssophila DSM 17132]
MNTETKLLNKNTKPTSMRILVYNFLSAQKAALSLSEIEQNFEHADRITIYRTLKTFEEKGIVHSIQENNTTRYKLCDDECSDEMHSDWHMHFYCRICKQTTCREDIPINIPTLGLLLEEVQMIGKGICENCLQTLQ